MTHQDRTKWDAKYAGPGYVMGDEHQMLLESQSVQALDDLDYFVRNGEPPPDFEMPDLPLPDITLPELPDVAAPPPEALEQIEELSPPDAELEPLGG